MTFDSNDQSISANTHFDLSYISEEIPICIAERTLRTFDTLVMSPQFRDDFIWIRVLSGIIDVEIDGLQQMVHEGETLFINSRHLCTLRGIPEGTAVYRILIARPDAVGNPLITRKLDAMIKDLNFSSTVIRPANPLFSADMDAILDLSRHRPQEYEFELLSHYLAQLRQILRIYAHTSPDETVERNTDLDALREMMAFIGENYKDEVTLDMIARAGKVSRSKCTRLFRTYIQKSPIHHLQSYRLERSVYLLKHTTLSISEIALQCGFNQQSYFNRLFLRTFGVTPKEMRVARASDQPEVC